MDISSFLGGCNTVTGSFTVISVSYGPYGCLQSLDATFEQHCEGATAALRGEIQVVTPQAPPAQQVQLTINPKGMVTRSNGLVFVQGLVSCPQTVAMPLSVNVSQAVKKGTLTGSGSAQ